MAEGHHDGVAGKGRRVVSPVVLGVLLTFAGAVAFGMLPIVLKALYEDGVEPESAVIYRYAGSLVLLAVAFALRRPAARGFGHAFGAGFAVGAGTIFLFHGYANLPASLAVLIFFTYPAFTVVVGRLVFGVPLEQGPVAATVMVVLAAGLIVWPGRLEAPMLPWVALTFGAPLGYAFFLSCLARLPREASVLTRLVGVNVGGCVAVLPVLLIETGGLTLPTGAAGWLAGLYLPLVGGIGATALFIVGASLAGGSRAAVAGSSELLTALAVGWWLFGEPADAAMVIGAALIVAAIPVSLRGRFPSMAGKRRRRPR